MDSDPDYAAYSLDELYDAERNIDATRFPARAQNLHDEIAAREAGGSQHAVSGGPDVTGDSSARPTWLRHRPLGTLLIGILAAVAGPVILYMTIAIPIARPEELIDFGISPVAMKLGFGLLGALYTAAGVGLLLGRRWGWWLACFASAFAIVRYVNVLRSIPGLAQQFQAGEGEFRYQVLKYSMRILFESLFLFYLLRPRVVAYFRLQSLRRLRTLVLLFGTGVAVAFLLAVLNAALMQE